MTEELYLINFLWWDKKVPSTKLCVNSQHAENHINEMTISIPVSPLSLPSHPISNYLYTTGYKWIIWTTCLRSSGTDTLDELFICTINYKSFWCFDHNKASYFGIKVYVGYKVAFKHCYYCLTVGNNRGRINEGIEGRINKYNVRYTWMNE